MPKWSVRRSQAEWVDEATWHAHTAVVVNPQGREVSLEEVVAVLNLYERQLRLAADMPALISG